MASSITFTAAVSANFVAKDVFHHELENDMAMKKKSLMGAKAAKTTDRDSLQDPAASSVEVAKPTNARKLAVARLATAKLSTAKLVTLKKVGG